MPFSSQVLLMVRLTVADAPVRLMAILLFIGVSCILVLHGITFGADEGSMSARIHFELGLSKDRSAAEIINYGIAFLAAALFLLSYFQNRAPILLFMACFMLFVWFDDSIGYHERVGRLLVAGFELPAFGSLRAQDTGEILAWAVAAVPLFGLLAFGCMRRQKGDMPILFLFMAGAAALFVCGVLADLLNIAAGKQYKLILDIVEDGGEMLAITYLAMLAVSLSRNSETYYNALHANYRGHEQERLFAAETALATDFDARGTAKPI